MNIRRPNNMWKILGFLLASAFWADSASGPAFSWEWAENGKMLCDGLMEEIGITNSGGPAYISRIHEGPNLVPGFTLLDKKPGGYMILNGVAHKSNNYEVLCGKNKVAWAHTNVAMHPTLPPKAIPVGNLDNGTSLYACRTLAPGKGGNYLSGFVDPATQHCNSSTLVPNANSTTDDFIPAQTTQYEILIEAPAGPASPDNDTFYWEWSDPDELPCPNELVEFGETVGNDKKPLALARIHYGQHVLPGYVPDYKHTKVAYFSFNNTIYTSDSFEVLCGDGFAWQAISSKVLLNETAAVALGKDPEGNPIYACRVIPLYSHSQIISGMVDPDTHNCNWFYMPESGFGSIFTTDRYEILVSVHKDSK